MKLLHPSDFILKEILIPATLGLIFALGFLAVSETDILLHFIYNNKIGLWVVGILLVFVFFWTFVNYSRTLDEYEAETKDSKEAVKKNIKIWMIFWTIWALYFSIITVMENALTFRKYLVAMTITILPGVFSAVLTEYLRWRSEREKRETVNPIPPFSSLQRKYWSGYYGLICIPIYTFITLLCIMILQ